MILRMIRWIFGYIIFKIEPKKSKIFLNLVSKNQMHIWDINKTNEILFAKISSGEYEFLYKILKRNNIGINPVQKIGLPFFYLRNKNRKGVIIGIIIYFIILHIFSMFIWKINIIGNKKICNETVESVCTENGIFVGASKKKIKCKQIGQDIMAKVPNISWISINLDGCVANICMEEQIDTPKTVQNCDNKNIVSECDAQIIRMETFSGTPMVKSGDVVLKNQILVGAFDKDRDGKIIDVNANANVWAKVSDEISEFEKFKTLAKIRTGKKKKSLKFRFFNKIIDLNFWQSHEDTWEKESHESNLNIRGVKSPFGFLTEKFYETKDVEVFRTKKEIVELAKRKIYENIKNKRLNLMNCVESQVEKEDGILFKISFEYLKNIAVYDNNKK